MSKESSILSVGDELDKFFESYENSNNSKIKLLLTFDPSKVGYNKKVFTVTEPEKKEIKKIKITTKKQRRNNKNGLF